ncbi:MAG: hypothetical protein RIR74_1251, partial [Pseudomonadota bacterium]
LPWPLSPRIMSASRAWPSSVSSPQSLRAMSLIPPIRRIDHVGNRGEGVEDAVAVVLQHRKASISLVQRHLRIGYNRAARLLDAMEKAGLVSPMQSNGNRDILVPAGRE